QLNELIEQKGLQYLKTALTHAAIDYKFLKFGLIGTRSTKQSAKNSLLITGQKIRSICNNLPTGEILYRNYPLLITNIPTCPQCCTHSETTQHFWDCDITINNLHNITAKVTKTHIRLKRSEHLLCSSTRFNSKNTIIQMYSARLSLY